MAEADSKERQHTDMEDHSDLQFQHLKNTQNGGNNIYQKQKLHLRKAVDHNNGRHHNDGGPKYLTQHNIQVRSIVADIVKVEADGVVTSEDPQLLYESQVTKALCHLEKSGSHFAAHREEHKTRHARGSTELGNVFFTSMNQYRNFPFKYVLHAVVNAYDGGNHNEWMNNLSRLYSEILLKANDLRLKSLCLPFLGTGYNQGNIEVTFDVAIHAVNQLKLPHMKSVCFVCLEKEPVVYFLSRCQKILLSSDGQNVRDDRSDQRSGEMGVEDHAEDEECEGDMRKDMLKDDANDAEEVESTDSQPLSGSLEEEEDGNAGMDWIGDTEVDLSQHIDQLKIKDKPSTTTDHFSDTGSDGGSEVDNDADNNPIKHTEPESKSEQTASATTDVKTDSIKVSEAEADDSTEDDTCPICMDTITDVKKLHLCGHTFCRECIDHSFHRFKPVCPSCQTVYGVLTGNMPNGTMDVSEHKFPSLEGYEGCGIIVINYMFRDGKQTDKHPHPGRGYSGTCRTAYLPNNCEGQTVLALLRLAFDRNLTFTVGRSVTTGRDNCVIWNDIHHKTNTSGGATDYGYPDTTYLSRVTQELASKGVTEDQLDSKYRTH